VNGTTVPLLPVLALDVKVTPASVHALAARSEKAANMLDLVGRKFPIGLVIVGLGFELVALLRLRKNRKLAVEAASAPAPEAAVIR
jgi:hypothetical protein